MTKLYASWDLEVSDWLEEGETLDDVEQRDGLLGISCAAVYTPGTGATKLWPQIAHKDLVRYPDFMSPVDVRAMLKELEELALFGFPIVTWNGAGFDLRVLAMECQGPASAKRCAKLALDHIDPGFQMLCEKGFMCGLDKANKAMGLAGKLEGMHGALAPVLWTGGDGEESEETRVGIENLGVEAGTKEAQDLCLAYVGQDAVATGQLYEAVLGRGMLQWITGRGGIGTWIPQTALDARGEKRLLTVRECLKIPLPDVSWAKEDFRAFWRRERWYAWIRDLLPGDPLFAKKDEALQALVDEPVQERFDDWDI